MWLLTHGLSIVGVLVGLAFARSVLGERRAPASALAWLLVIFLVPYVGLPLFWLFGARKIRRAKRSTEAAEGHGLAPGESVARSSLERMLQSHGTRSPTENNAVQLIPDGQQAFFEVLALIEGAERSIHVTTFILGRDAVGEAIVDALAAKAASGTEVRLLLDGLFASRFATRGLRALTAAGGRWARFVPVLHLPFRGRANLRNHRKAIIVDGERALVGGMNLAAEYLGPDADRGRWRDLMLAVSGPAVRDLADVFVSDWAFAARETLPAPTVPVGRGQARLQVVASGPDEPGDALYDLLLSLTFEATERLWIATPYFIPDEALERGLILALRRGVDVCIVVPAVSNHPLADWARGTYLRGLQRLGARIRPFTPGMLHAKATLVDRKLGIVGSANSDLRSLLLDYEVSVLLHSAAEIAALEAWFDGLLTECATTHPAASRPRRALESVGRLVAPLV